MTTEKARVGSAAAQLAFVDEKEGLARLFDGILAGVIWRRRMQDGMQSWLDTLPVDQLPTGRIILPLPLHRGLLGQWITRQAVY